MNIRQGGKKELKETVIKKKRTTTTLRASRTVRGNRE